MAKNKKHIRRNNGDGSFYYDAKNDRFKYTYPYFNEYGERRYKTFYGKSEAECITKREEFEMKMNRNLETKYNNATISQILRIELEKMDDFNEITDATYLRKDYTISIIEKSRLNRILVEDLTESAIMAFLKSVTSYSNSTISKIYTELNKALDLAVMHNIVDENLIKRYDIKKPKSIKKDKKVHAFTIEEQQQFEKALEEYKPENNHNFYKTQLQIMLYAGLRVGEVNALSPSDIDFNQNVIKVRKTISKDKNSKPTLNQQTKTYSGKRDVPISNKLKPILEEAIKNHTPNKEDLLFKNIKGTYISPSQVNSAFTRICKKHNIKCDGQHMLRHTFATRCIEARVPAEVLKKWLGHKDVSITINTYTDVFNQFEKDNINKVNNYMDILN